MLEAISIPIEVHDRFSTVLGRFQQSIDKSTQAAERSSAAFQSWTQTSQNLAVASAGATSAWENFTKTSSTVASASSSVTAALAKTAAAVTSLHSSAGNTTSSISTLGKVVSDAAGQFLGAAGRYLQAGKGLAESLIAGFNDTLQSQLNRIVSTLDSLADRALTGLEKKITASLGKIGGAIGSIAIGALGGLISSATSALGSFFKKIFSKPSIEVYAESSGKALAQAFGIGYTKEMDAWITQAAAEIAKRLGSETRKHMSEAKWVPSVISKIIEGMASFSRADQENLAHILETHTRSVLENVLKLSPEQAAGEMAPIFEKAIQKALSAGESLSENMMRMLQWAQSMGANIEIPADAFHDALQKLVETGDVGSEKFENLITLAQQLGLSLQGGFQQGIDALQSELDKVNSSIISIYEHDLQFREQRLNFKQEFVNAAISELQAQDSSLDKEKARNIALQRYKDMQQKVKDIFSDNVVTLEEIQKATEGMTNAEKKTFIELAKQRQERIEIKNEERQASTLRETQQKLLQAINKLVKAMGGEFENAASTFTTFQGSLDQTQAPDLGLATQLQLAQRLLEMFKKDLQDLPAGSISFNTISGQGGFDYLFRGPSTGYPVPVILHGNERLTATPMDKHHEAAGFVFNVNVQADSASGGRAAADSFIQQVQTALDTKRLRIPQYSIDHSRI